MSVLRVFSYHSFSLTELVPAWVTHRIICPGFCPSGEPRSSLDVYAGCQHLTADEIGLAVGFLLPDQCGLLAHSWRSERGRHSHWQDLSCMRNQLVPDQDLWRNQETFGRRYGCWRRFCLKKKSNIWRPTWWKYFNRLVPLSILCSNTIKVVF